MGFCTSFARLILILFNVIFWLSGVAILAIGIWILVDPDIQEYQEVIKDATDEEFLKVGAYILMGFGAFVFLVGFSGCCGAIRKSKCLLGFYMFFLLCVFAGELAAGVYVAVHKGEAEDKLDEGLKTSIKEHYGDSIQSAWDLVQKELKCCGGQGATDYDGSKWQTTQKNNVKVPTSCCILGSDGMPLNETLCQKGTDQTYVYKDVGCKGALVDWIDDHSMVVIGVGCGIAALELIGLVCAFCFCRHMNDEKYESA